MKSTKSNFIPAIVLILAIIALFGIIATYTVNYSRNHNVKATSAEVCATPYLALLDANASEVSVYRWKNHTFYKDRAAYWSVEAKSTDGDFKAKHQAEALCDALENVWHRIEVHNSYNARKDQ